MAATIQRTADTCPGQPCGEGCDHVEFLPDPTVETEVWEPDTDRPGFLRRVRTKTVDEVFAELYAALNIAEHDGVISVEGCDEYLSVCAGVPANREWPAGRLVVFPVTGGNEGHYTHIGVMHRDSDRMETLILGKTFDGWDACWAFAKRVARILGV